ncbi:MAG: hypothetical protein V7K68_14130 [Nostoc sp.]|uniref:hypothetical protein n=1 Tax=Nostoc sp. TaxID=1180 RepID=UPI002FF73BC9
MSARSTEMRKRSRILRRQYAYLLAENTKMSARSTEMRKRSRILRRQYALMSARSTEMRRRSRILRRQYAFLLTKINSIYFYDAVASYGDREARELQQAIATLISLHIALTPIFLIGGWLQICNVFGVK